MSSIFHKLKSLIREQKCQNSKYICIAPAHARITTVDIRSYLLRVVWLSGCGCDVSCLRVWVCGAVGVQGGGEWGLLYTRVVVTYANGS